MHLKRLEMSGFKSFANRTELEFVPGITAVVGPNGSGKSNVTDAIRWVLGEQSAKSLRGSKMEDVIFLGSDTRKPVGFCEVSITLDNTKRILPLDYAEVTVTRRVYRSGESEYLLNRQSCRLKDIQELFMDTGIGKEAYSMIGQGRIEEMISNKSEDRRAIFEEAAGIVKYKARKKESEKKLADAEQNLLRIRDLIHELRNQLEPLQEQAEKAEQFKVWQQELTEVEISFYVHKIETLNEEWIQTSDEVKRLREEQATGASEQSKEEAELAKVKWKLTELEKTGEKLQSELLTASEQLEQANAERKVYLERGRNREESEQQLAIQLETLQTNQEQLVLENKDTESQLLTHKAELSKVIEQLDQLKLRTVATMKDQSSNVQLNREQVLSELYRAESEEQLLRKQLAEEEAKGNGFQTEKDILLAKKETLEQAKNEVTEQLTKIASELTAKRAEAPKLQAIQSELIAKQTNLHAELLLLEKQLVRLRSEREVLQEMEQNHTGFFQGVKEVLENRSLQGIIGAVAELIGVPAAWEQAIETALGGALQHVVVADEQTARSAITFLKEKRLGRATFLPLTVMKSRSIPTNDLARLSDIAGFIGVASELITTEPSYQHLIGHLLGNVLVTESLPVANQVAKVLSHRYRVVTVEGDIVNPGGSMTGGSRQNKKPNLLARGRQLEELAIQIGQLQKKQEQLQQTTDEVAQEVSRVETEWEALRSVGEQLKLQEQEILADQREKELQCNDVNRRLESFQKQELETQGKLSNLQQRLTELVVLKSDGEAELAEITKQLEEEEAERQQQADAQRERNEQLTELRVEEAKQRQIISSLQGNLRRIQDEQQKNSNVQQKLMDDRQKLIEMGELGEEAFEQLLATLYRYQEEKKTLQAELSLFRTERDAYTKQHQELEQVVYEQRKKLRKCEERLHQQEVRVNRLDVELNHLLQKLAEEYETSFEGAKEKYGFPEDPNKAERRVKALKQQLDQLGEVNLGAIEEYKRLTERLSFLTTQEADLLQAKQQLYQLISQMVLEMGQRFADSFALIREEFQDVFVKMFGGGRADLQLTDPNNLLETGIEIVAQPPGKKLQQLSLLSGGERSLTALALLFAVLRIKPVPFCFLDEVDAALDEANLTRFTHYLQKFADQTQFIIITHRKHTMEGAHVLYGITMQESGVSTLVSVKLEEYDITREVAATKA